MTEDLAKKLNTAGAFDTPWLKEQLLNWDAKKEQQKADFMEHMYNCAGRQDKAHPLHALYTGLWQDFCIQEAGSHCRDEYFARLQFVKELEEGKHQGQEVYVS